MFFLKNLTYLKSDLNLTKFSALTKIPYRTLQDIYANNTENPRVDTLIKLKECFNISLDDLIFKDLSKEENKK